MEKILVSITHIHDLDYGKIDDISKKINNAYQLEKNFNIHKTINLLELNQQKVSLEERQNFKKNQRSIKIESLTFRLDLLKKEFDESLQ